MVQTVRLMLIDDHPLVAQGLSALIDQVPEFQFTGYAEDGSAALNLFREQRPDLMLVDLRLPGESGLDVIRTLRAERPDVKCIILTSSANLWEIREALRVGVDGYILKDTQPEDLLQAMRRVASGHRAYDARAMELVVRGETDNPIGAAGLSDREREVLGELTRGRSNKEISQQLFISENTVKKHISSILAKLQLQDRTQAALFAVEHSVVGVSASARRG